LSTHHQLKPPLEHLPLSIAQSSTRNPYRIHDIELRM
jgi:hypothetical protein